MIEDNWKATNSPNYRYRLTVAKLEMIRSLGGHKADTTIRRFISYHEKLIETYASKKEMTKMPVKINNQEFYFLRENTMNYRKQLSKNLHLDLHQIQSALCGRHHRKGFG